MDALCLPGFQHPDMFIPDRCVFNLILRRLNISMIKELIIILKNNIRLHFRVRRERKLKKPLLQIAMFSGSIRRVK